MLKSMASACTKPSVIWMAQAFKPSHARRIFVPLGGLVSSTAHFAVYFASTQAASTLPAKVCIVVQ